MLGVGRLSAAEDAMRSARPGDRLTFVVVTGDPAETGRLARLRIVDLIACLRRVFAPGDLPRLRLVFDDTGSTLSAAIGHGSADDSTELAIRTHDGLIVARADGRRAGHAVADREDETAETGSSGPGFFPATTADE
ncbi:hypothetical protein [Streptomyces albireticuli]|uniref:hypothetical protein n=1 Tax=Streptomyces albireticuli TaxID=1940 RepID=UPI0036C5EAD0